MNIPVYNVKGEETSKVRVDDSVFKIEPNEDVIHRAVVAEMTNSRQGTHSTKTRSEVRGGGRKPWRQKGRGVARAGTIRSPIWRGGGVVFGPKPRDYKDRLPKKMKKLARRSALSQRVQDKAVYVVDEMTIDAPRTKDFRKLLQDLGLGGKKITVLVGEIEKNLSLSARNLPNVFLIPATDVSTYDLLDCEAVVFDKAGIKKLSEQLAVN
ncbi:MAG: 50S ribosomal protein L4 [Candidatus Marinimicrobia bacterium]|jgi:large subunit ribosomal protein L4|nr:50S ribosomal protein L4 [Candidatus Neomarinimicrobiota bacterium]MDP6456060.1 50S ribosomal protein L4 [Candidatus Neomarinimicrobiota bacterium]MDP6592659.1 50S ribosomal protein L4 [Candidatus Neomarinimicrobiota bacterium]MDP6836505.1 50S ribosomal protein L4 [Candidatus Neomarinimicrobiota bacterium]MDP6966447.1 50S ribosomal protein L4 [Candidatus Neomarinimicrobiota bacterium]|tara:strand:- start:15837 stop:16466 length:630 start_codon:yes stop_codon:yes gene_type:complete